jgi:hypothetical protein
MMREDMGETDTNYMVLEMENVAVLGVWIGRLKSEKAGAIKQNN